MLHATDGPAPSSAAPVWRSKPTMSTTPDALIDQIQALLAPLGQISVRRMFGGHGVYCDDRMLALLADGQIWLKVDALSRPEFEAVGAVPFTQTSKGKPVATSYWSVPDGALADAATLRPWAERALQAAIRAADGKRDQPAKATYPGTRKHRKQA